MRLHHFTAVVTLLVLKVAAHPHHTHQKPLLRNQPAQFPTSASAPSLLSVVPPMVIGILSLIFTIGGFVVGVLQYRRNSSSHVEEINDAVPLQHMETGEDSTAPADTVEFEDYNPQSSPAPSETAMAAMNVDVAGPYGSVLPDFSCSTFELDLIPPAVEVRATV